MTEQRTRARDLRANELANIGAFLSLVRDADENDEAFASRCHYAIDALIVERATLLRDGSLLKLMHLHNAIEECFPDS